MFKIMFVSFLITAVVSLISADEISDLATQLAQTVQICRNNLEIADDQVVNMFKFEQLPEDTIQLKLYVCVAKTMNYMTDDNQFDKEKILNAASKLQVVISDKTVYEKIMKVFNSCLDEVDGGEDEIEVARNTAVCVNKYIKEEQLKN